MIFSSETFLLGLLLPLLLTMALLKHVFLLQSNRSAALACKHLPFAGHVQFSHQAIAIATLIITSLIFYSWQKPEYLLLLLGSIAINRLLGWKISQHLCQRQQLHQQQPKNTQAKPWLILAIVFNLSLLAYFKYQNFFLDNVNGLFGLDLPGSNLLLPLGISFFTFQQIAWQVDLYQERTDYGKHHEYLFFIAFFPQLVAGPIVHYRQLIPQIRHPDWLNRSFFYQGLLLFSIGLAKKILIADNLAVFVDPLYLQAEQLSQGDILLNAGLAWAAALGYGLQLYFDFSGYADMAMGIALMLGLKLPYNFIAPYKATSLIDFWRRWHITLSHFLRDYIYIPLGGNRRGAVNQQASLLATMLLGGLWHGAGWQFILWGGLHGLGLTINHTWRKYSVIKLPAFLGWALTLLTVMVLWVSFRAPTLESSLLIWKSMIIGVSAGQGSGSLIEHLLHWLHDWKVLLIGSLELSDANIGQQLFQLWQGHILHGNQTAIWLWILLAGGIALLTPSSYQWMKAWPKISRSAVAMTLAGAYSALLIALCFKTLQASPSQAFLYFNF